MPSQLQEPNGLSQEINPNLRIFTENWISCLQKADFDDLYTIGSEFATPTRSHTPFPVVSAKNAVSENFYCQILRKFSRKVCTIFRETPLNYLNFIEIWWYGACRKTSVRAPIWISQDYDDGGLIDSRNRY